MREEDRPYIAKVKVSLVKEGTVNERIVIDSQHDAANLQFIRDELLAVTGRCLFACTWISNTP